MWQGLNTLVKQKSMNGSYHGNFQIETQNRNWYTKTSRIFFIEVKERTNRFFFYTTTWLPPLGCQASPSQGVATGQKLAKSHEE